jgi:ribosome-associated toxin RatA of RatAB toxin-antitoxin module
LPRPQPPCGNWSAPSTSTRPTWSTEIDRFDEDRGRVDFEQTDGDLERFSGHWLIEPLPNDPTSSDVSFFVDFEIGIPLLADMLNPIARRSLRDNAIRMLQALERQIRRAA